jgi:hypothetical protein
LGEPDGELFDEFEQREFGFLIQDEIVQPDGELAIHPEQYSVVVG